MEDGRQTAGLPQLLPTDCLKTRLPSELCWAGTGAKAAQEQSVSPSVFLGSLSKQRAAGGLEGQLLQASVGPGTPLQPRPACPSDRDYSLFFSTGYAGLRRPPQLSPGRPDGGESGCPPSSPVAHYRPRPSLCDKRPYQHLLVPFTAHSWEGPRKGSVLGRPGLRSWEPSRGWGENAEPPGVVSSGPCPPALGGGTWRGP